MDDFNEQKPEHFKERRYIQGKLIQIVVCAVLGLIVAALLEATGLWAVLPTISYCAIATAVAGVFWGVAKVIVFLVFFPLVVKDALCDCEYWISLFSRNK
jgi:hypothetical protein